MFLFIWHQILGQLRGVFWKKNLLISILTTFFYLYLSATIILIGYFADLIIEKLFPGDDLLERSTQLLFYYFIFDIIVRLLLQRLPEVAFRYYALLPIRKSRLVHYPLTGSVISIFNLLPMVIIIVFFFKQVFYTFPTYASLVWLVIMICRVFINNYVVFALKKRLDRNPILLVLSSAIFTSVLLADILEYIALSKYWYQTVYYAMQNPYMVIIPLLILALIYWVAYLTMSRYYYPEEHRSIWSPVRKQVGGTTFLRRFGTVGRLVEVEIKLILRNKRPRTILILSVLFVAYFYTSVYNLSAITQNEEVTFFSHFVMVGFFIFSTGWLMILYGQLLFAWESTYFEGLLSSNIRTTDYIASKFWLIFLQNACSIVIVIPSILVDLKVFLAGLACILFNSGITSFLVIFFGLFNTSRVDPNKTAFMNYQGANILHFALAFVLIGVPLIIYLPFALLSLPKTGLIVIGVCGLTGIALRNLVIGKLSAFFEKRKYIMARGYKDF